MSFDLLEASWLAKSRNPTKPPAANQKADACHEHCKRARFGNHGNLEIVKIKRFGGSSRIWAAKTDDAKPKSKTGGGRIKGAWGELIQGKRIVLVSLSRGKNSRR